MSLISTLRSRGTQVEAADLSLPPNHAGQPCGPKTFFRVLFGDKTLQFKMCTDTPFRVLFSKIDVIGCFMWHTTVIDPSLSPQDYGMQPGEDNVVTLRVERDPSRKMSFSDEIAMNDVARSHAFKRRLAEEKAERLEAELDEAHRQINALHQELRGLTDRLAAETSKHSRAITELEQRNESLQQLADDLQSQIRRMADLHGNLNAHQPRYRDPTQSSLTASATKSLRKHSPEPGSGSVPSGTGTRSSIEKPTTLSKKQNHGLIANSSDERRRLEEELREWQNSTLFKPSRSSEVHDQVPPKDPYDEDVPELASHPRARRLAHRVSPFTTDAHHQQQPPTPATLSRVIVHVTFVDEALQTERTLNDVVINGSREALVSEIAAHIRIPEDLGVSIDECTMCVLRSNGGGHVVVAPPELCRTWVADGDTVYVAKMSD